MKDALESFIKDALKQQNKQQKNTLKRRQLLATTTTTSTSTGGGGTTASAGIAAATVASAVAGAGTITTVAVGTDATVAATATAAATSTATAGSGGSGSSGSGSSGGTMPQYLHSYVNVVHSWMDSCQGLGCGQGCALSKSTTPTSIPVALLVAMKQRQLAMLELIDTPGSYSGNIYPHLNHQRVGVDKDLVNNMYNAESASEEQEQDPEEDVGVPVIRPLTQPPMKKTKAEVYEVTSEVITKLTPVESSQETPNGVTPKNEEDVGVVPVARPLTQQPQSQSQQSHDQSQQEDEPQAEEEPSSHQAQSQSLPPMNSKNNSSSVFSSLHLAPHEHGRALSAITVPASLTASLSVSVSLLAHDMAVSIPVSALAHDVDVAMADLAMGGEEHCR